MPSLKQLICQVEWALSEVPFDEYAITYWDGIVQCYIPAPSNPTPFSIRVQSEGFIAPGLAVIVFIDGVYQCNRNRCGLVDPHTTSGFNRADSKCSVEFRLRQQEQCLPSGKWLSREWCFQSQSEGKYSSSGSLSRYVTILHYARLTNSSSRQFHFTQARCLPKGSKTTQ